MLESMLQFGRDLNFPQEALDTMQATYETIASCPPAMQELEENIRIFWNEGFDPIWDVEIKLNFIAMLTSMAPFPVYLVFYCALADEAWRRYQKAGLGRELYLNSMHDLYCKIHITYGLYKMWGLYCSAWFNDFFLLKRFGLGRLEYELFESPFDYDHPAYALKKGQKLVNVHIPASGPLAMDGVVDSLKRAVDFYNDDFPDSVIPFLCETWMLYEPTYNLMPEGGNLRKFADLFTVVENQIIPGCDDRWRIFHMPNSVPISTYPEDTRMQRSMKKWLLEGNRMGNGLGIFFYDRGTFLKPTEDGFVKIV